MTVMLQPDTGIATASLPYPFYVDHDGEIGRQDYWKGKPARVVGFVADPDAQRIDLHWRDVRDNPYQVIGLYLVTEDESAVEGSPGRYSTHLAPIGRVSVR